MYGKKDEQNTPFIPAEIIMAWWSEAQNNSIALVSSGHNNLCKWHAILADTLLVLCE